MRILIVGGGGQLAFALAKVLAKYDVTAPTHRELDITDRQGVLRCVAEVRPDIVINTAAIPSVEECERRPAEAMHVNCVGTWYLASACHDTGATMVQVSTDYVFDGRKGRSYTEADATNPLNVYGLSKAASEDVVRALCPRHYVIRTAKLFGPTSGETTANFVVGMLAQARDARAVKAVADDVMSPTFTVDVAAKISELLETEHYGTYHVTNHGECSRFELAETLYRLAGIDVAVEPVTAAEFGGLAVRPTNTALDNFRLASLGMDDLRPWEAALEEYVTNYIGGA